MESKKTGYKELVSNAVIILLVITAWLLLVIQTGINIMHLIK